MTLVKIDWGEDYPVFYVDDAGDPIAYGRLEVDIPQELYARYLAAVSEWSDVQDAIGEIARAISDQAPGR